MTRTVVFDFGNVVAFFDHGRALAKLERFTDMPAAELALHLYGSPLEDAYERGAISTAEYARRAKVAGRLECPDDVFLVAFADIFTPNPEVCDLIPRLKPACRLLLASNTNEAHYLGFTAQFADVLSHFDAICPSHHAGHRKPEAAYFEYCHRSAGAEPAECLFIDDLAANVDGAVRHGWQGLVYRPGCDLAGRLGVPPVPLGC